VYGLPSPELRERARRNELKLGGCLLLEGSPNRACLKCRNTWLERLDPNFIEAERLRAKLRNYREQRAKKSSD
jgi:hypothetical protein